MSVPTYEQRTANILSVADLDTELKRAKLYARRMKVQSKKAPSLEEKLAYQKRFKEAESVLRKLRANYFDIEDQLLQKAATC